MTIAQREATFAVENPATGELIADVPDQGAAEALMALDRAVAAASDWATTAARARGESLRRLLVLVERNTDELASLLTSETGKSPQEAATEVAYAADFLRWFAEEAVRISGRYGSNPAGTGRVIVGYRPVGPCYLITPWNFPLAMATRKLAPALAAGCTAIVKPAELTPLTTIRLGTLAREAGIPTGVVNIVATSTPAEVTEALLSDPRLRKLSFTGSTPVGRRLLALAARHVLRTSMELGGNAPFIVFEDADLDAAIDGAMQAKFRNSGQACTAANRFLVHETLLEPFTQQVAQRVSAATVGPLINSQAVARLEALLADAVRRGARVLVGGRAVRGPGHHFEPTVVADVRPDCRLAQEEIFGPILAIGSFTREAEAVRLANGTEHGLVAYVYTRDLARAQRLLEVLEVGMTGVNVGVVSDAAAPFGGIKASGLGREGGAEGIHEYLETTYALTADPFR
ncbi:MAG TPA: NAD-dependent succinate-semialdehyde dehydrogenase [Solirubrobacteraceae bacterium]